MIETLAVYCRKLREIEFSSDFQFKSDYFNLLSSSRQLISDEMKFLRFNRDDDLEMYVVLLR